MDLGVMLTQERIDTMVGVGAWPNKIILDYVDAALAQDPDLPAITDYNGETGQSTSISYGQLDRLTRRMGLALINNGIKTGDVVSLQLPNWWQFNAMHLACARIGAITNPLMPIFRERELTYMLGFAESKMMIAPDRFRGFEYKPMMEGIRGELPHLAHIFYIDGKGSDDFGFRVTNKYTCLGNGLPTRITNNTVKGLWLRFRALGKNCSRKRQQ